MSELKIKEVYLLTPDDKKILLEPFTKHITTSKSDFKIKTFKHNLKTEYELIVNDKKSYFKFRNKLIGNCKSKVRYRLLNKARKMYEYSI